MNATASEHRLKHQDVESAREIRGRSMLLFITDRCPVGCAHCSVDSRPDSPIIQDFDLFQDIVQWLCEKPGLDVIGISGGEPFIERRGLTLASKALSQAGKHLVVFTSGVWATSISPPGWIADVLAQCSCVYLSTDSFHTQTVSNQRFIRAARSIAAEKAWIVVQVLDYQESIDRATMLLQEAFGAHPEDYSELNIIHPLTNGRGANIFRPTSHLLGNQFGACSRITSPMVRYDGLVTGCCNEGVIMNFGPGRLRRRAKSADELEAAVTAFHADPLLKSIGGVGLGVITEHPKLRDLGEARFQSICHLCWEVLERMPDDRSPDHLIETLSLLKP